MQVAGERPRWSATTKTVVVIGMILVIVGVLSGAAVAGVAGVVLAAPVIATARLVGHYLKANLYDEDPFSWEKTSRAKTSQAEGVG